MDGQRSSSSSAAIACGLLVGVTIAVGWIAAVDTVTNGGNETSGNALLLTFAIIATVGACIAYFAWRAQHRTLVALGLLLVVASPTVFAYPLNVAVLLCSVVVLVGVPKRLRRG